MKNHYEDDNIKIRISFPKKKCKLLANATIVLKTIGFGEYTTKGFQIWPSNNFNDRLQEKINITPPSRNDYHHTFITFFENLKLWYELERLIYSAYLKASEVQKRNPMNENINPEDVPM